MATQTTILTQPQDSHFSSSFKNKPSEIELTNTKTFSPTPRETPESHDLDHRHSSAFQPSSSNTHLQNNDNDNNNTSSPPTNATSTPQRWNSPTSNIPRLLFASFSFIVAGMNDAAVGALIPSLETHYALDYTTVSLIFLTPFAGYALAAVCNASIHTRFGQRGIALTAPACHLVTYIVIALHPPFPVIVVVNVLSGFGNGLTDACFCAWVGVMQRANAVQGLMHAMYSVGALLAPLIATSFVVRQGWPWWTFYYVMVGASVVEWAGLTAAFWRLTGEKFRAENAAAADGGGGGAVVGNGSAKGSRTRQALKSRITWTAAAFFFTYMGIEVGLGGWVITFMQRVRRASPYDAGLSGTGFWAGMTVGRAGLGFITERYGERRCVAIYLAAALALQLIFWLVPQFLVSAIAVAFLGVFLGPMFPGCVMMATKLLPKHMHVSALGFAMALGGTGGTVFPFIIGAIASSKGVKVLQPIILALIACVVVLWLSFPRIKKRD